MQKCTFVNSTQLLNNGAGDLSSPRFQFSAGISEHAYHAANSSAQMMLPTIMRGKEVARNRQDPQTCAMHQGCVSREQQDVFKARVHTHGHRGVCHTMVCHVLLTRASGLLEHAAHACMCGKARA